MLTTGNIRRYVLARTALAVGMAAMSFSADAISGLWALLVVFVASGAAVASLAYTDLHFRAVATAVGDFLIAVWLIPATGLDMSPFIGLIYVGVILLGVGVSPRAATVGAGIGTALWLSTLFISGSLVDGTSFALSAQVRDPAFIARICSVIAFLLLTALLSGYLGVSVARRNQLLESTERRLLESRLSTDVIVESLSTGLVSVGRDRGLTLLNTAGAEALGVSDAVPGTKIGDLFSGRLACVRTVLLEVLEGTREDKREVVRVEDRLLGFHVMPVREGAEMIGVVGVFRDVTDAKEAETRRRRQDRLATIGALSAGIVHELRNTLKPLAGAVELLEGDLDPSGDQAALIRLISEETDALEHFLSAFLEFAGDGRLDVRSFVIGDLLDEVFERVRTHEKGRRLAMRSEGNLEIRVEGDSQALKRMLINMAMNTAMVKSDGQFVVCVFDAGGDEMLMQVSDDGPGIPLAARSRVFEPFYTTKPGGTGLGLAIVKRTVERHGGSISVTDSALGGTRFEIRMPTTAVNEQELAEAA